MDIKPALYGRIVKLLRENIDPEQRQAFLSVAFFRVPALRDRISIEGSNNEFATHVLDETLAAPRLEDGTHPLSLMLNALGEYLRRPGQRELDEIQASLNPGAGITKKLFRWETFGAIATAVTVLVGVLTFLFGEGVIQPDPEPVPETSVVQVTDAPTDSPSTATDVPPTASDDLPRNRSGSGASANDPSGGDLILTELSGTATGEAQQIPPSATGTRTPRPPTAIASRTPVPTRTPRPPTTTATRTPPPTFTPRPSATPLSSTPASVGNTAVTGSSSGTSSTGDYADWTPETRMFDGVEMVRVPPGCFLMGGTDAQAEPDERPVENICFNESFWIDRYEVSNEQFERLGGQAANKPSHPEADSPRNHISWFEAQNYCDLRSARLPTEAEWEYAASGPDNLLYPWGNELIESNLVFVRNSNRPAAVDTPANISWVGAFNMAGNVSEWTGSLYSISRGMRDGDFTDAGERLFDYPYNRTDGRNMEPPEDSALQVRIVVRGGSYNLAAKDTRTSAREEYQVFINDSSIGIRCVRDAG